MAKKRKPAAAFLNIPPWLARLYILCSVVLIPWTIYLAINLPAHHITRHWDVSWSGLDITMAIALFLTGLFSYWRSKWVVICASVAGTLIGFDAWFDVTSALPGKQFDGALLVALLVEVPLTLISFRIAVRALHDNQLTHI